MNTIIFLFIFLLSSCAPIPRQQTAEKQTPADSAKTWQYNHCYGERDPE